MIWMCVIWICEAIQVWFEAQPWCSNITQVGPYPNSWKKIPRLRVGIRLSLVPYTHSLLIKMLEHFICIWYWFVKHSKRGWRLNHDVTTSDNMYMILICQAFQVGFGAQPWCNDNITQVGPYPNFWKLTLDLGWVSGQVWCHIPIHNLTMCRNTSYIYMILICEAFQVWFEAQPWCITTSDRSVPTLIPKNWPSTQGGYQAKSGAIYPFTA